MHTILLLTKSHHTQELYTWLFWHLHILQFDRVILFDNSSTIDIQPILSQFPNSIEYHLITGWPDQYRLYNSYLQNIQPSPTDWIIALDDDEYLYLDPTIYTNGVKSFTQSLHSLYPNSNRFYLLWTTLLSPKPIEYYTTPCILTHTAYSYSTLNRISSYWSRDNGWGKCLVRLNHIPSYSSQYLCGHIPKCMDSDSPIILVSKGTPLYSAHLPYHLQTPFYTKAFIAHYQFRTRQDWKLKCNTPLATHKGVSIKDKVKIYSMVYQNPDVFIPCFLLKDLWFRYRK